MQGKSLVLLLVVLYGSAFLAGFNENLVNMALMSIMNEYGITSVTAQWLVTGYMIVATVVVMCMAFLYRRFKLRSLYFFAALLTLAGSILGLFASSFELLMAARLIQAVGSGIFIPLMMNTVLVVTPKNKLGTYLSIGGCMITFGPALAPVVCGALVTSFGWHSIFVVPTLAVVVLGILALPSVKNLENTKAHLDIPSAVLSAVFLTTLSYGLVELTLDTFIAAITLVITVASGVAFVIRQLRCQYPLIDLTPMKSSAFWPSIILTTIAMMGSFSCSVLLPLYFEGACELTAFIAGLIILVPVLGNCGSTLLGGRIMDKHGEWPLLPMGYGIITVGFVLMALFSGSLSIPVMFLGAFIVWVGTGFIFSPSQTAGLKTLPPEQNPFGVALSTTFVQIAACIGPSLYTGLLSSGQESALAQGLSTTLATANGFSIAMIVAACIAAAGFFIAFVYSRAAVRRAAQAQNTQRKAPATAQPLAGLIKQDAYVLPCNAPVSDAIYFFVEKKIGGIPLINTKGEAAGFVSDGDILRYITDKHSSISGMYALVEAANNQTLDERMRELLELPVGSISTEKTITIDVSATLEQACELLSSHKVKKLPVVQHNRVVGTINRSDIIRYALQQSIKMAKEA